jgi:hypothetical protein
MANEGLMPIHTPQEALTLFPARVREQQPLWCILQFSKMEGSNLNGYRLA